MPISILAVGLFVLAVVSGMLGLGVAFAAVPFLGLFLPDLVHQVQPLSLVLNGVTALFSTFGFARSGHVIWKHALALAVITTLIIWPRTSLSSTSGTFTSPPSCSWPTDCLGPARPTRARRRRRREATSRRL